MNVLVAGGAGFIGSNLIDALLAKGHRVICVDNFFIGTKKNIEHLRGDSRFTFYEQDLAELDAVNEIFEREQVDIVYHMAANSDIQASAAAPEVEYKNTYTTTFNILEAMRRTGVKRFFFCSTSAVYGDAQGSEVNELYAPLAPISYYGACKLGCEGLISAYSYMNDYHSMVFRFPNVIGPRLTHGVIFDFMKRLRDDPTQLTILGDGDQCKPYLYVGDLVSCILRFTRDIPAGVTTYNVGGKTQSTVTGIARIVCREMGLKDVAFHYTGGRGGWKGDVPVFAYNLDKIHAAGWHASMTSDEAVALTVEKTIWGGVYAQLIQYLFEVFFPGLYERSIETGTGLCERFGMQGEDGKTKCVFVVPACEECGKYLYISGPAALVLPPGPYRRNTQGTVVLTAFLYTRIFSILHFERTGI